VDAKRKRNNKRRGKSKGDEREQKAVDSVADGDRKLPAKISRCVFLRGNSFLMDDVTFHTQDGTEFLQKRAVISPPFYAPCQLACQSSYGRTKFTLLLW
jgi:hypothetical protein